MMIPLSLVFLSLLSVGVGEIRRHEIRSDNRNIILLDKFGFSDRGSLELNLTVFSRSPVRPDHHILSKLGFFLCTGEEWLKLLDQIEKSEISCVLESARHRVFTFDSLPTPITTKFDFMYPESQPGLYTLLFVNCNPGLRVSMNVRSAMYNLGAGEPNGRDYLSAGETTLPQVYLLFAIAYLAMASFWFSISQKMILRCELSKHRDKGIHFLMLLVVVMKGLYFLCEAGYKLDIKTTGYARGWFYALFYVFGFFKDVAFFPAIILIGSGWTFLKADSRGKEKKVLMIVIPLQLVANAAQLLIYQNQPYGENLLVWYLVVLLADTVCWCVVLFRIVRTNRKLSGMAQTSASSGAKAELSLPERSWLRQFYVVVICYITFTRVVVPALEGVTCYEYVTSGVVLRECATLAFCVFTGYRFRPV